MFYCISSTQLCISPVRWEVGSEAEGIAGASLHVETGPWDGGPSLGAVMAVATDMP